MNLNQKTMVMANLDVATRKFRVAHSIHTPLNATLEEGYWREVADQMMCVLELELWGREITMDRNVVVKNTVPSSLKAYLWQALYNRVHALR